MTPRIRLSTAVANAVKAVQVVKQHPVILVLTSIAGTLIFGSFTVGWQLHKLSNAFEDLKAVVVQVKINDKRIASIESSDATQNYRLGYCCPPTWQTRTREER